MMPILLDIINHEEESVLRLRAKATDCIGNIGLAVGRELFDPYFEVF